MYNSYSYLLIFIIINVIEKKAKITTRPICGLSQLVLHSIQYTFKHNNQTKKENLIKLKSSKVFVTLIHVVE